MLFLRSILKILALNVGDIIDFKDFRLVEKFMRNTNSGQTERLELRPTDCRRMSTSSHKTAGNLKTEWRMRFIAILRFLDSKHEHYVVEEVFKAQFAFADDYLTLISNLRLPIVLF